MGFLDKFKNNSKENNESVRETMFPVSKEDLTNLLLDDEHLTEYWASKGPKISKILNAMSIHENWTAECIMEDNEEEYKKFTEIFTSLGESIQNSGCYSGDYANKLIEALAYMSSQRAFRILNWLDNSHPEESICFYLIIVAKKYKRQLFHDNNDNINYCATLFLDRLKTLKAVQMLSSVYREENIVNVSKLLEA